MTTDKPRKRKFTDEFKADAVQLVEQSGRTVAQVARELEINESTLLGWVKAYRRAHPDPATAPTPVLSDSLDDDRSGILRHGR